MLHIVLILVAVGLLCVPVFFAGHPRSAQAGWLGLAILALTHLPL